jgi:hypothetical protein
MVSFARPQANEEDRTGGVIRNGPPPVSRGVAIDGLFCGTSGNPTGTANDVYTIDVATDVATSVLANTPIWGATADNTNRRVLFTSEGSGGSGGAGGDELFSLSFDGGVPVSLGMITNGGGNLRMDGLAYANGNLYGSNADGLNNGLYRIDTGTLAATLIMTYPNSISGIDADPDTGTIYGADDTNSNLVILDPIGLTVTAVAAYPDGAELDLDGVAAGGGKVYLIPDDNAPGLIYVYDIASGTFDPDLTAPWGATADIFSGGAFISDCAEPTILFLPAIGDTGIQISGSPGCDYTVFVTDSDGNTTTFTITVGDNGIGIDNTNPVQRDSRYSVAVAGQPDPGNGIVTIPTLGEWGLIGFVLLLMAASVFFFRKTRTV